MIVRIWRTRIDQARASEYRDFAHSRSLPMFRAQPGFAGVFFAARQDQRVRSWPGTFNQSGARARSSALRASPACTRCKRSCIEDASQHCAPERLVN